MGYEYFKSHPMRIAKDQTSLTIASMLAAEDKHTKGVPDLHPAAGAFVHYGGVELADKLTILQPPSDDEEVSYLASKWNASCGVAARHLMFYVWRIIFREMRHGSISMCEKAFGPSGAWTSAEHFVASQCKTGSNWSHNIVKHQNLCIGPVVEAIERHFRKGGWSAAFGGKKWADIALELLRYLRGEASCMVAADRCWTLVHNGGPIFNKGVYFKKHDQYLNSVLNAQASSSVFSLGTGWPLKTYGDHPVYGNFAIFTKKATEIIQRSDPDYKPGAQAVKLAHGEQDEKLVSRSVGPIKFFSMKEEAEA